MSLKSVKTGKLELLFNKLALEQSVINIYFLQTLNVLQCLHLPKDTIFKHF